MLILQAIIALPKILGFADSAIKAVSDTLRSLQVAKDQKAVKATDAEISAAIAKAKDGVKALNEKWDDTSFAL